MAPMQLTQFTPEEATPLVDDEARHEEAAQPPSTTLWRRLALAVVGASMLATALYCGLSSQVRANARAGVKSITNFNSVHFLGRVMVKKPVVYAPPAYNGNMHTRRPQDMTRALPEDAVAVHWLLSSLLMEEFGNNGAQVGLYHVGVGFTNHRTGLDSSFQFRASHFDSTLLLPSMNASQRSMRWSNNGSLSTQEGKLDLIYWGTRVQIATISGEAYNRLLAWAARATFPKYVLFSLAPYGRRVEQPHRSGGRVLAEWPPGATTCFDVAQALVDRIADVAGTHVFNKLLPGILRDDQYLWVRPGSEPEKLNMSAAEDFQLAWKYFAVISEIPDVGVLGNTDPTKMAELVSSALSKANMTWAVYVDQNEDYWRYKPHDTFAGYVVSKHVPLPSGGTLLVPSS